MKKGRLPVHERGYQFTQAIERFTQIVNEKTAIDCLTLPTARMKKIYLKGAGTSSNPSCLTIDSTGCLSFFLEPGLSLSPDQPRHHRTLQAIRCSRC
ncbi:hypothetical protein RRG08_009954 [Elysia crispata]|uniref:Uncharacterized protein n=1 Tax=Elysia crispata TaxID=231223 RepID=A0AAE1ASM8_9GAST|nr:hypothetical protein RRG08_009954 [Elysia crispata]